MSNRLETLQYEKSMYGSHTTPSFDHLRGIRLLQDNWDGNDAPKPTNAALTNAETIISLIKRNNFAIDDIDGDVDGGIFIAIANETTNRSIHFYCGNGGQTCQLFKVNGKQISYSQYNPIAAVKFLNSE